MTQEENVDMKENPVVEEAVKEQPEATSAAPEAPEAAPAEEAAAPEAAAAPAEPTLEEQLEEMKGNYLRTLAELENYRKRCARDLQDERQRTRSRTIEEILGVYDILQMAVDHSAKATDMASMRQGIEMSFGEFKRLLDSMGVKIVDATGAQFDAKFHQAISSMPSEELPEGMVISQWRAGFMLGEKLIRPATVVVSSGPATPPPAEEAPATPAQ